jgi:hypothetical protein
MHAHEVYAYEVHGYEVHAYEVLWRDKVCQKAGYVRGEETVAREG